MESKQNDLIEHCSKVFGDDSGPYKISRQILFNNLIETGDLNRGLRIRFRTALENIGQFFEHIEDGDYDSAEKALDELIQRLEKIACEGARENALYHQSLVQSKMPKWPFLYKLLLVDVPDGIREDLAEIEERIELGDEKNPDDWRASITHYRKSAEIAERLHSELPSKKKLLRKSLGLIVAIISVGGGIAGIASFLLPV